MVILRDKETGAVIGEITDSQLNFLRDQFEEESSDDTDYYINEETLDMLEEQGADAPLLGLLRKELAGRKEMEIQWTKAAGKV